MADYSYFFQRSEGSVLGPVSRIDIEERASIGDIAPDTPVRVNEDDWKTASDFVFLRRAFGIEDKPVAARPVRKTPPRRAKVPAVKPPRTEVSAGQNRRKPLADSEPDEQDQEQEEDDRRARRSRVIVLCALVAFLFAGGISAGILISSLLSSRSVDTPAPGPVYLLGNPEVDAIAQEGWRPGTPLPLANEHNANVQLTAEELFAKVSPAVGKIDTFHRRQPFGVGSGFVIASNGVVVTNYHVIRYCDQATITFPNGARHTVSGVVCFDPAADLAILKVDGEGLPVVSLSNDAPPPVGSRVYAIGSPQGLSNTLSDGLVSGHRRARDQDKIQTTAPISPGSSGGPLLSPDGRVIGVTTAFIKGGQNLNLAVPVWQLRSLLHRRGNLQQLAVASGAGERAKLIEDQKRRQQAELVRQQQMKAAAQNQQFLAHARRELQDIESALENARRAYESLKAAKLDAVNSCQFRLTADVAGYVYGTIYNGHESFTIDRAVVQITTNQWVRKYNVNVVIPPLTSRTFGIQTYSPNTEFRSGNVVEVDWPRQSVGSKETAIILRLLRRRDELREILASTGGR